uniref:beta strand repeat-containing protein n=1 Tax=Shewanella sp. TaxID=50422 RepID=UPI004047E752
MALVLKDRVKQTTTTAGTGTITLSGTVTGFSDFSVIGDGNTTYYAIVNTAAGEWEVGYGTYTASGTTLTRTTVLESSNSGSLVNFSAGAKDVFVTYPAEKAVAQDNSGNVVISGNVQATTFSGALSGNASTATKLATARSIGLTGDVSGSANFDGSANISITATVADDSHNHIIGNVDGLQAALNAKAPLASPALTGTPTAPTAVAGTNTTQVATTSFVSTAVANLVDSAPATLDTLNELAAALGDDPNFATTVSTSLGTKAPLASPALTGTPTAPTAAVGTNTTQVATTAFVNAEIANDAPTKTGTGASGTWGISVTGNAATATKLATARTIGLSGDVSGSASFDGSANATITAVVADDSHNHIISNVDGLQAALDSKQPTGSYLTGNQTITLSGDVSGSGTTAITVTVADDSHNHIIGNVDGLQTALDGKAPLASPALTGTPTVPTAAVNTNTTQAASTAFVVAQIADDAPTKTGTGASGTWGINVTGSSGSTTGNAATATTLQTSRTINGVSFNGSANITVTANTPNTLSRGSYLTGSNFNGGSATTWAVDATSANTASTVVARDASGNFSAGTITATLSGNATSATSATTSSSTTGNAATATTLQTARTINGVSFNGSADITVEPYVEDDETTDASRLLVFVDNSTAGYKRLNEDSGLSYNPSTNTLTAGTFSGALSGNATTSSSCTGNAATATTLQTARTINGTSFNGSANITVTANTTNTLTRGSYLTGSNFNGSAATTWAVDATSANTASKVVARDASGNFSAGTITASLSGNATTSSSTTGNAATATTLQTARTINGTSFNGSANITVPANIATSATASAFKVPFANTTASTTGNYGLLQDSTATFTYNPSTNTLVAGTFSGALSGNATTATTLQTSRTINGTSFNGSANITTSTWGTARTINGTSINGSTDYTTANWGTSRTLTIGNTGKSVNGSGNVSWSLSEIGATAVYASGCVYENNQTITANYTMTTNANGMSAGPITIDSGITVTIPSGSAWTVV